MPGHLLPQCHQGIVGLIFFSLGYVGIDFGKPQTIKFDGGSFKLTIDDIYHLSVFARCQKSWLPARCLNLAPPSSDPNSELVLRLFWNILIAGIGFLAGPISGSSFMTEHRSQPG